MCVIFGAEWQLVAVRPEGALPRRDINKHLRRQCRLGHLEDGV